MVRAFRAFALAAGFAACALSAQAADIPGQAPAVWNPPSRVGGAWQGFYVGGHLGSTWSRYDATLLPANAGSRFSRNMLQAGAFAGINFMMTPQVVGGFEADIGFHDMRRTQAVAGGLYAASSNWQSTFRGRLGFSVDNFLFYGTAGLAVANLGFQGPAAASWRTKLGLAAGVGAETRFTDNLFGRLEYLYTGFAADDFVLGPVRMNSDYSAHTIRAGIGYRF
jgi:outer membrane immunogenic protein